MTTPVLLQSFRNLREPGVVEMGLNASFLQSGSREEWSCCQGEMTLSGMCVWGGGGTALHEDVHPLCSARSPQQAIMLRVHLIPCKHSKIIDTIEKSVVFTLCFPTCSQ